MRIGISCVKYGSGSYGGVQIFLNSYIKALSSIQKSENEYVLIFNENIDFESLSLPYFFKIFKIKKEIEINVIFRILKRLFKRTFFYKFLPLYYSEEISKQLSELNLDIIHFPSSTFDIPFEFPKECKKIITFHDLQHEYYPEFFSNKELEFRDRNYKKSLFEADKIISISNYTSNSIIDKYNIPSSKINTIYESYPHIYNDKISEKQCEKIKRKYSLPDNFIFYPGNPWPHKNHFRLFQALTLLYERDDFSIPLVLSGVMESNKNVINEYVKEIKYPSKMLINLGFIPEEEMPVIYFLSKMLIYPSLFEGFGIPLLEAMVSKCPVVCSKNTSIPEVCGDAAYYIDPMDINSIADGIYEVYSNKKLRKNLVNHGFKRSKKFNWSIIIQKYLSLYQQTFYQKIDS